MFEKYGEFNSAEELNRAAAKKKEEGDLEALIALAIENGLEKEDAEDYMSGFMPDLCNTVMAGVGKLKVESANMRLEREFEMLEKELEVMCLKNPEVAAGVRKKGKSLAEYLAKIIDKGYKDAVAPPKEILAKVTAVPSQYRQHIKTGMPDKMTRTEIMKEYYCGEVTK